MPWQLMTSSASRSTGVAYRNTRILYFGTLLMSLAILPSRPSHALDTQKSDLIYGADFLSLLMAISSEADQEQNPSRPLEYAQIFEYKNLGTKSTKTEKLTEILDKRPQSSHLLVNTPSKYSNSYPDTIYRLEVKKEDAVSKLTDFKDTIANSTEESTQNIAKVRPENNNNTEIESIEASDGIGFKKNVSADTDEVEDTLKHLLIRYLQKTDDFNVETSMPLKELGKDDFKEEVFKDEAQTIPIIFNVGKQDLVDNSIDRGYVRNSRSTGTTESSSGDKSSEVIQNSGTDTVKGIENSDIGQHRKILRERELDYEEYPARVRPLHNPHFAPTSSGYLDHDLDKKLQQTIIYHDNQPITHTRSISYSSVIQNLPSIGVDPESPSQHERRERNYNTGQHFTNTYENMEKKLNDTAKLYGNEDIPQKDLLAGHPWTQHTKNDGDITTDATVLSNQDNNWNKQLGESDSYTTQKSWDAPKALPYILPTPLTTTYGVQTPPNILVGHQKQAQNAKHTLPNAYDKQNAPEGIYDANIPQPTSQIYFGNQGGQTPQNDAYTGHGMVQNHHQLSDGTPKDSFGVQTDQVTPDNPYGGQERVLNAGGSSENVFGHQTTNHNAQDSLYSTNIQLGSPTNLYAGQRMQQNGHGSSQGPYEDGKPQQSPRAEQVQKNRYGHLQSQDHGQSEHTDGYRNEKQLPRVYARPEQNYEVEERISLVTNGRAHGVHQHPTSTPKEEHYNAKKLDDNQKVGYVVEGRNYKKYRVEERTSDGFIVGEYGVVSHNDGSLRGVRYTADGTINPKVISEALMKFLSL
ncbi:unnamed protein product [Callosobruchus maculatus]|uniref:Uncharacterized protein n=1 Tax=Callosobruchus maculatus TaxID=64391 RepID=A0A653D5N5_CALMS|nr:unnamed protein product [Callosobruchus maculatus]